MCSSSRNNSRLSNVLFPARTKSEAIMHVHFHSACLHPLKEEMAQCMKRLVCSTQSEIFQDIEAKITASVNMEVRTAVKCCLHQLGRHVASFRRGVANLCIYVSQIYGTHCLPLHRRVWRCCCCSGDSFLRAPSSRQQR